MSAAVDAKATLVPSAITVPAQPDVSNALLVLADSAFLAGLASVEQRVGALSVKDAKTAQQAADLLSELTTTATQLEKCRTNIKAPFLARCKAIDAAAKGPTDRIENLKGKLRVQISTFTVAERERIAGEQREREEQIRKLEAEKLRQEQAAAAKAKADAAAAAPSDLEFDDDPPAAPKTAIEKQIDQLKFTPAAPAAPLAGVAFRTRLAMRIADVNKIPDAFVIRTPNEKLLRATYCAGFKEGDPVPSVPGIEFWVDSAPVSTGKANDGIVHF